MENNKKSYQSADIKPAEKSTLEITGSISAEIFEENRPQALKNLNQEITIDGFRKGMVPENILITKVGEMTILEEMAELAISKAYFDIIIDNKIDALGKPVISITKLAKNNPLEFKIKTAIMPEVTLPDYKKIAQEQIKKAPKAEKATEKEIEEAILRIRKAHAPHSGHDHEKMTPEEHQKAIEKDMPEVTDDFVKKLGNFSDVADFRNKLSKIIDEEKINLANEKQRISVADAIADATKIDLPEVLIGSEIQRMEAQFKADVERMGIKMEDYLKHAKKTLDEIRSEWQPHAQKKAKLQIVLNAIAKKENIKPEQSEIDNEVTHILEHYKDANRERATVYAETVLTNEKVFQFLESSK